MRRIWSLDLSTHTGFSIFDYEDGCKPQRLASGTINIRQTVHEYGPYPHCYRLAAGDLASDICRVLQEKCDERRPDVVVIEETNGGRSRYTQKLLENIHTAVLWQLAAECPGAQVVYLNSDGQDGWRTTLGLRLSIEQKRQNAKLSRAAREARKRDAKLDKKKLGISGKVTKKHLAISWVRNNFGLDLKVKDNNEAEAIAIGVAYCNGTKPCDGVK